WAAHMELDQLHDELYAATRGTHLARDSWLRLSADEKRQVLAELDAALKARADDDPHVAAAVAPIIYIDGEPYAAATALTVKFGDVVDNPFQGLAGIPSDQLSPEQAARLAHYTASHLERECGEGDGCPECPDCPGSGATLDAQDDLTQEVSGHVNDGDNVVAGPEGPGHAAIVADYAS